MKIDRHWLMTGIAVIAALGLGFGAARLMPPAAAPAEPEDHAEEAGSEGFVPLGLDQASKAGVQVSAIERGGGTGLMLPGRVAFAPGAEAVVDAPLPGAVMTVHVGVGTSVSAGSPLVTLRSPDGAASRADVDAAVAAAEAATAAASRDRTLFGQGYVARSRLDITEAEARRAEAALRAARARVAAFGAPGPDGGVVVRSPIDGVVTRVSTSPGQVLHEEDQEVAAVADVGRSELVFTAPPAAAARVALGDTLTGRTAEGQVVTGVVIGVAPPDPGGTVTVRARATGALPPAGTVLSARLANGTTGDTLVVPSEAVQTVDGVPSVFVAEPGGFRVRPVTTGASAEGRTEILNGLTGSERIAGVGAFLLKAELAKGEAEHGH